LEELHLQYNQLTLLPLHLRQLTSLKCMDLQGNPLQSPWKTALKLAKSGMLEGQDMLRFRKALMEEAREGGADRDGNVSVVGSAEHYKGSRVVVTTLAGTGPSTQVMILNSEGEAAGEVREAVLLISRHYFKFENTTCLYQYEASCPFPWLSNSSTAQLLNCFSFDLLR
jgi:hypothetical protein